MLLDRPQSGAGEFGVDEELERVGLTGMGAGEPGEVAVPLGVRAGGREPRGEGDQGCLAGPWLPGGGLERFDVAAAGDRPVMVRLRCQSLDETDPGTAELVLSND